MKKIISVFIILILLLLISIGILSTIGVETNRFNNLILNKINQIAKKNKVLLNPTFDVVDLTKIKNIQKKLKIKL